MLKALFKKQLMEVNTWLIQNKKNGKNRSLLGMAAFGLLYAVLFAVIGGMFYYVGGVLCGPLMTAGFGWLYIAVMGLLSIALGVFGSVFNTYSTLYKAKDNEFLLSMPIPPSHILAVRLFGVWMWCLIYEAIVFIPAVIVYWQALNAAGHLTFFIVLFCILLLFLLSVFILILACILGWVVAKISTKLKNRSIVTVILSLAFLALYYWGYSKAYAALNYIIANAQAWGETIRGAVYPLYWMGRAAEGDVVSLLLLTALIAVIFAAVYWVMTHTFLKMATVSRGEGKKAYRETAVKVRGQKSALLWKEQKRFTSNPNYMLNCGLGTILIPAGGILFLVKADWIRELVAQYMGNGSSLALLIACAILCSLAAMNDITAPSVSLEGKNLWIAQSLPVPACQVLAAKLKLHLLLTGIPAIFCAVCIMIVLRLPLVQAILLLLQPLLYVVLTAAFGLMLNLKSPNLKWTNEAVPIKQSMGVIVSLLGGWMFVIILGVLYYSFRGIFSAEIYLLLCTLLTAALSAALLFWLKNKGAKIFQAL